MVEKAEKRQRFTFVNNIDTALTAKTHSDETLPKKRTHKERGSSSSSEDEARAKKRHKKEHKKDKKSKDKKDKDKKDKKRKKSYSSEDSAEHEHHIDHERIRDAAIDKIAAKFKHNPNEVRYERDANKDEPLPKVNQWTGMAYSQKFYEILEKRKELPAWAAKKEIMRLVSEY